MKIVTYTRVSTKRQGQSGLGLEAQEAAIQNYIQEHSAEVAGEFVEVESGKKSNRPQLAKAIALAKRTKSKLVVAKLDRLARNVHFISGLLESKVDFVALDFPEANTFTLHIMAALVGTGANNQPTGLLNDTGINSHTRASNGINSLADMAAMEKAVADNNGEDSAEDYFWIADTATRETLRNTPATAAGTTFGRSLWEPQPANNLGRSGVMGYEAIASVHAAANTLVLAQKRAMAFVDFNKLQVENLVDAGQAKEGFRTMLVSGYFDFAVLEPNGICKAVNS